MSTISLCMIVRNEEQVLRCCLDSICSLVDEILIADTGSTDLTKEIAKDYTEKIWDFPWIDDFSAARNFIISKARSEYFMWLDADDCLPAEQASSFSRRPSYTAPGSEPPCPASIITRFASDIISLLHILIRQQGQTAYVRRTPDFAPSCRPELLPHILPYVKERQKLPT